MTKKELLVILELVPDDYEIILEYTPEQDADYWGIDKYNISGLIDITDKKLRLEIKDEESEGRCGKKI